jgi:hypothetical protein
MAHPHLASTLARFSARVQRTKNRLLAIPAEVQEKLGLERRAENDIVLVSIRKGGAGRWNHHLFKLTSDNEFAIPADVTAIGPGDEVEVKVHAMYPGTPKPTPADQASGAGVLLALAKAPRAGWRTDGSTKVDEYLANEPGDGDDGDVR